VSRLLIESGNLLGLSAREDIRLATDLYCENGAIVAHGEEARTLARRPGEPTETLVGKGRWVLPGFVQAHLHLCQTILRGAPEGLPLMPWLQRHVWPGEAALDFETLTLSARLGLAECLSSGVTAVLDMGTVRHSDALFRVATRSGIRYTGGNVLMDDPNGAPASLRTSADAGLAETERLLGIWHGRDRGRLRVAVQPRFAVSCTEDLLRRAAELSAEKSLTLHTHASENRAEIELVRLRSGRGNLRYLDDLGLLTPRAVIAHAVHAGPEDWSLLAERGASVAHCPGSNLRLSSGVCPVPDLRRCGVRVALGSDGAPSNDRLDLFREMRLAALLPVARGDPALPAFDVLRMATHEGAAALGLEGTTGLAVGSRADLVLLDPDVGYTLPGDWGEDPYASIVFSMGPANVAATVVDGVVRYRAKDPAVGGLKPPPDEVRTAAKVLRARMKML
jgi:cytosine/adenosine deaminase-related metal-dependent hydrolase